MDTLFWKQLNKTVSITYTRRLFHDKYAHRIKIWVPAGRLLQLKYLKPADYKKHLDSLIARANQFVGSNYFYSQQRNSGLKHADHDHIAALKSLIEKHKDVIKVRIEEPHIIFYSNDTAALKEIAESRSDRLVTVTTPKNDAEHQSILAGNEIRSKKNEYKYRLILAGTGFTDKESVCSIISNPDMDIGASKGLLRRLDGMYFSGGYVYTNDEQLAFLLNLAKPGIVKKIYSLVDSVDKYQEL